MHTPGIYHTQWRVPRWVGRLAPILFLFFGVGILLMSVWQQMEHEVEKSIVDKQMLPVEPTPVVMKLPVGVVMRPAGILPDNPLYVVAAAGDRIRLWLTKDPVIRAQINRDRADQRLMAATQLVQKGKLDLAIETLVKAERYLLAAQVQLAACERTDAVEAEWRRLLATAEDHRLVIDSMKEAIPEQLRGGIDKALEQQAAVEMQVRAVCDEE